MTRQQLRQLLRDGEGPRLEFKRAEIKPSDLAESFVALANSGGGMVLLGVNDMGSPIGVPSLRDARDLAELAAHENIDPPLRVTISLVRLAGGQVVLAVRVPFSKTPVMSRSGRLLIRRGSQNMPATAMEVAELFVERGDQRVDFPYEIIHHDITLSIADASGDHATLRKSARVRFLQDQVIALRDRTWGEGELAPESYVRPGAIGDRYQEDHTIHSLVSLREAKRRGDVATIDVSHRIENGFRQSAEWFEVEVSVPTRELRVEVQFPASRPPRDLIVRARVEGSTRLLTRSNVFRRGQTVRVVWRAHHPALKERYRLEWRW